MFKDFPILQHFSINTYFRYLIPSIKPNLKKALWIDADILVLCDLKELFELDLNDKPLGAVPYLYEHSKYRKTNIHKTILRLKEKLNLPSDHLYFNAGVMVLNLEYWRKKGWMTQLFALTNKLKTIIECPDQDILNILSKNHYRILPDTYNSIVDINYLLNKKYASAPKIIHFTGGNNLRPWTAINCPYRDLYMKYANQTPFKTFFSNLRLEKVIINQDIYTNKIMRFLFQKKKTKKGKLIVKVCKIPIYWKGQKK